MRTLVRPISAVIATKDRPASLARTLASLGEQKILPSELIVVDGSGGDESQRVIENWNAEVGFLCRVRWDRATRLGAATQRNQGLLAATEPFVWFFDDDIRFEQDCVARLWRAIESDSRLGGVNAMIVNQKYHPPGRVSRMMFTLLHGRREESFAGKVIGPAVNLLPQDRGDLPEVVPVDWLNTTCTIYRRESLPSPPFDSVFAGYSMMEDLTLSLRVAKKWRLANARTALIFHDTQPSAQKIDIRAMSAMELVNRHYVMTKILGRTRLMDYFRLFWWELFQLAVSAARAQTRGTVPAICRGKWQAIGKLTIGPVADGPQHG